ncbi:MAG: hypothetical protein ACFCUN_04635 [Hyphomicrobiaceae bacterium]
MPNPSPEAPKVGQIPTTSLSGHIVPDERLETIAGHVAALSKTALVVARRLPLGADTGDVFAVMAADVAARESKEATQ